MPHQQHADIQGDLKKIADDLEHLAADVREEAEQVAEDAIGAQFVTATDLTESIGTRLEFGLKLGEIWMEQLRLGAEDYSVATESIWSSRSPEALVNALSAHFTRRAEHAGKGISDWYQALATEQQKLSDTHQRLWTAFRQSA